MKPKNETELCEIIAQAQDPLEIRGGGTKSQAGLVNRNPVETAGLTGISMYDPGSLTMVVAAGTPVAEIESTLASAGQCLPFEPMDYRGLLETTGEPTIGGVAAANVSGPRRVSAGACRDFMIGVRFVDGRGRVIRSGGRVMKNVTGYDLVKLLAGSRGTLGVLTEIAFKVLPVAEFRAVLLIEELPDHQAVAALSKALGSPYDVNGAAHLQKGLDGRPVTMIRIEGFEESVRYRAGRLQELLREFGAFAVEADPGNTQAGWQHVRDVECFHGKAGDVWRLSVRPSDAPDLVARVASQEDIEAAYDWGGGLIWMLVPEATDLRSLSGQFDGHATLVRASERTLETIPVFHPQPPRIAELMDGLKRQFDPRQVLNPGIMV